MVLRRERYVAVCDNRSKIFTDYHNWQDINKIKDVRILSWASENKAKAALKMCNPPIEVEYEIVQMTETIDIPD